MRVLVYTEVGDGPLLETLPDHSLFVLPLIKKRVLRLTRLLALRRFSIYKRVSLWPDRLQ